MDWLTGVRSRCGRGRIRAKAFSQNPLPKGFRAQTYALHCGPQLVGRISMHQTFGSERNKFRAQWTGLFLYGLVIFPIIAALTIISFESAHWSYRIQTAIISFIICLLPIRHLLNLQTLPAIEISDHFLVTNQALFSRRAYNLNKITRVRRFRRVLYFLHNHWPTLLTLDSKEDAAALESLLTRKLR